MNDIPTLSDDKRQVRFKRYESNGVGYIHIFTRISHYVDVKLEYRRTTYGGQSYGDLNIPTSRHDVAGRLLYALKLAPKRDVGINP